MVSRFGLILVTLMVLIPQQSFGQGIFQPFGFPKPVVARGQTEVVGSVHLGLTQGPILADTLVIDLSPLRITNNATTDIRVAIAGNITIGAVTIDAENGKVRLPVTAGGTSGSVRIDGIRVAIPGSGVTSITARLSWAGSQNILTPDTSVVVVDRAQSGLAVDPMTDRFTIFNNVVYDATATIIAREGFATAFVSSTDFGQSTPTQIRVRVTDFPTGLQMKFPATVTANESAATLTTVEGAAVDLPRANGNTDVVYNFTGAANSANLVESFNIPFTVSVAGRVQDLQPTIELSLAPIGAAVPTGSLPSIAVPRFAEENLAVLEGTSRIITKTLYAVGVDMTRENRLFLFNPSSRVANITLTAFDASGQVISGTNISNSVRQSLPANQSSDQSLNDIFGSGATNIAAVRVQSTAQDLLALSTVAGNGLLESLPLLSRGTAYFVIPSMGDEASLAIFNAGTSRVSGTLALRSAQGAIVASKTVEVGPSASLKTTLQDLFGTSAAGQVSGTFGNAVFVTESFGGANTLNLLAAEAPAEVPALYVPFFATGSGYSTDLSVINMSGEAVSLTAQLYDHQGAPAGSSKTIGLSGSQQLITTVADLFGVQGFSSGYARIQVPQSARGFWTYYPAITGHVRIRTGQAGSTVIPISGYPLQDSYLLGGGAPTGQFQGIALVNPNASAVTVTLQVLSSAGVVQQSATVNLAPGQIVSKLISETLSTTVPERSVIRATATAPIVATSITGTVAGDALRSVPAQR